LLFTGESRCGEVTAVAGVVCFCGDVVRAVLDPSLFSLRGGSGGVVANRRSAGWIRAVSVAVSAAAGDVEPVGVVCRDGRAWVGTHAAIATGADGVVDDVCGGGFMHNGCGGSE